MPLRGVVVSALAWHSLGREIESYLGVEVMFSTKHALKWLLSLCGGSDWRLEKPGWRTGEHALSIIQCLFMESFTCSGGGLETAAAGWRLKPHTNERHCSHTAVKNERWPLQWKPPCVNCPSLLQVTAVGPWLPSRPIWFVEMSPARIWDIFAKLFLSLT